MFQPFRKGFHPSTIILMPLLLLAGSTAFAQDAGPAARPAKYSVAAYVWPSCHDEPALRELIWPEGIGEWEMVRRVCPTRSGTLKMVTVPDFLVAALAALAIDSGGEQSGLPASTSAFPGSPTVVVANGEDPYYELAREIAQKDSLLLTDSLEEALAKAPIFLLWVVAPDRVSDKRLAEFGLVIRDSGHTVAVGIITGNSLEKARELYGRARNVRAGKTLIVNTCNRASHRTAEIICLADNTQEAIELSKKEVLSRLQTADHLVYNGHASASQFTLDAMRNHIQDGDLPPLPPLVADSRGCQTLRFWEPNSIALGFIDRGAAAYAGYSISPMTGWGIKGQAPFRLAWAGFPIGIAVSVMNGAILRCDARVLCYYLIGDPRIAFHSEQPYLINDDRAEGDTRLIAVSPMTSGILPLRIAGGARYDFVTVIDDTSISRGDLFGNSRLQMADFGEDRYLLYDSDGKDFVCKLAVHAPVFWRLSDPILDALDHALLTSYAPDTGTYFLLAGIFCFALVTALVKIRSGGAARQSIGFAMVAGIAIASCHGMYWLFRLDEVTVTANPVRFYPVSVFSTFWMTACGAIVYVSSTSWRGRALGAALGAGVSLFASLFLLVFITVVNALLARRIGVAPWGLGPALAAGIAFVLQFALCLSVFEGLRRCGKLAQKNR